MKNTVLLVEDSKAFALGVEAALKQSTAHEVLVAFDYAQAKELLSANKDSIFMAITDLNLPDAEDGAAARLMADNHLPCVAFTGNFSPNLRELVFSLGVSDYVLKNGQADIDYVVRVVERMSANRDMKVLVVDDSPSSCDFLKALIEKQCFQVTAVQSAEQAFSLIDQGEEFRIILVDLIMDGMDGFGLMGKLRARYDMTKMSIIGISGKASSDQIAQFMKYGGNDFILKPFQQEQVSCRVNSVAQMLEQFDRLGALNQQKNELLGMAAHDIRGPLGVVMSATSMLKKDVQSDHGQKLLSLASEAADNMEELLDQLLDVSAVEDANISIHLARFNLDDLLQSCVDESRLLAEDKEQELMLTVPREPVVVDADQLRIKEVIQNLLSNAIKYSQVGAPIEVRLSTNGKKARLEVIDEAGGIPEGEQHLLFKPFSQISTKPTAGERSTGLGLSICQRVMKLHDGELKYRSNRQVGSIFEVTLPAVES